MSKLLYTGIDCVTNAVKQSCERTQCAMGCMKVQMCFINKNAIQPLFLFNWNKNLLCE